MTRQILTIAPSEIGRVAWLCEAASERGLAVAGLEAEGERYYWGGPVWAAEHEAALSVGLMQPTDEWLTTLDPVLLCRDVRQMTLAEARRGGRAFVKPPSSKAFQARVYCGADDLAQATRDLPEDLPVQVSTVVNFAAEYRCFVLDGQVHTASRYATWGALDLGTVLTHEAVRAIGALDEMLRGIGPSLPSAVVVDIGLCGPASDPRRDVAIVEANMAWFAQPYWSETSRVLDVVLRSAGPWERVQAADRAFVR